MNTELYIARRLTFDKQARQRLLRPIIRISIISVALSLAVMIVAISVLNGFKNQVTNKVTGFLAHIQIVNYDGNTSYETTPIARQPDFLPQLWQIPQVQQVQPYVLKAGVITTGSEIQGVVLKGVDAGFDWSFFDQNMVQGSHFEVTDSATSNQVCISLQLANMLQLQLGDKFDMYFIQDPPRQRRFTISGIFDTKFGEFDRLYVLCDMRHPQRLNGWTRDQVSGFEVYVRDFDQLAQTTQEVKDLVFYKLQPDGSRLMVESVHERFPSIFDWLNLQDLNAGVILALMLIVAGFNMISSLLIIMLERSGMIGLLKALGMPNISLQKVFVYQSGFIALQGLLWGNVIGIGLCLAQQYLGIVSLDPNTYYLSEVPIDINWLTVVLLNAGALAAIVAMLLVPSMLVAKMNPSKVLRFN